MKVYYVYIMSNATNSTVYIGITNNLIRRVEEHKLGVVKGFTERYKIHKLVYYETTTDIYSALEREKTLKKWSRAKKNWLIQLSNPNWDDLSKHLQMLSFLDTLHSLRSVGMT